MKNLNGVIGGFDEKLDNLENDIINKEKDLKEKENEVMDMGKKEEDLIKLINEIDFKISSNEAKISDFEKGIDIKTKELDALTKNLEDLEKETIKEKSGKNKKGQGEVEIQLTDFSEELVFSDLKSFEENESGLRGQVMNMERQRNMNSQEKRDMDNMMRNYEQKWKKTRNLHWEEQEMRRKTEDKTRQWKNRLTEMKNKLEQEKLLRRQIQEDGKWKMLQINQLKSQIQENNEMLSQCQKAYDNLRQQMISLQRVLNQKQEMEKDLKNNNIMIQKKVLKYDKKKNDINIKSPGDSWQSQKSSRREMIWNSPVTRESSSFEMGTSGNMFGDSNSWKTTSSWGNHKAFLNGKEIDPNDLPSDLMEKSKDDSFDFFSNSSGFSNFAERAKELSSGNSFSIPVLKKEDAIKQEYNQVTENDSNNFNGFGNFGNLENGGNSNDMKVKRRFKQATYKKRGGVDIFN